MHQASDPAVAVASCNNAVAPPVQRIDALGLPGLMVFDIALRHLREHGSASASALQKALKLSHPVVESLLLQLRKQQLIQITATMGLDLTEAGQQHAAARSKTCRYAGPAPVPLAEYTRAVRHQRQYPVPTEGRIRSAFSELVLPKATLDRVGQSFVSGRPIFVYGEAGNGKTSVIERFARIFDDPVLVPYAVEVDGQIIVVFDPWVHRPVEHAAPEMDQRWVLCHRPRVMTAGELTPSMLNLRLDESSGIYSAPLQMKANNGVISIDDFGRQAAPPSELLNRWILPLDRNVDYLTLRYGFSFQIPFELIVAFATNLNPSELADDAFLRRVPNKIYMGPVIDDDFDEILRRVVERHGAELDPSLAAYFRTRCRDHNGAGLKACYPRDICEIIAAASKFQRRPFCLSRETIDTAVESYFVRS